LWVNDDAFSGSSKTAALQALKVLAPERVPEALIGALASKTKEVQIWACRELAELKDKASADALAAAARNASPQIREAAAAALSKRK
jgi:HEAT repeat protein